MSRKFMFLLSFLLFAATGHGAWADGADDKMEAVREHFEKGQTYFEQGKYGAAASEFHAGYEIKPAVAFLYNEALCYERMADKDKAVGLYKRYLAEAPQARDKDAVELRIARLTAVAPAPAEAAAPALHGAVFIESKPPGAVIYLDDKSGAPLGTTPWNGSIEGRHKIIVSARGFKDATHDYNARPGAYNILYMQLSQEQYLGWLEVRANVPSALVYLDGTDAGALGHAPYMGNVTPGKHKLIVTREGYTEDAQDITITAGEALLVNAKIEPAPIGYVQVQGAGIDGAKVKLDGKVLCPSAPCRIRAASGEHQITVSKSGKKTYSKLLTIGRATETDVTVKLASKPSKVPAITKIIVGAALIGGGTAMTLHANSLGREIDANPNPDDDDKTKKALFRYGGAGLLVAGGALTLFGVVGAVSDSGPPSIGVIESRDLGVSLAPEVAPGYAGLSLTGTFGR